MKILVTGAGALLGQGIIKSLRASSLKPHIVAVDPSPLSAGLYWADSALLVPMASDPDYHERMLDILNRERPDVVIPGTDVELLYFANARSQIEAEFNTHVIISSPKVIRIADDKWLTAEFFKAHGFGHVPSCLPGDEEQLIDEVGFPLIVKPRVGARSVGVNRIESREQLRDAIATQKGIVIQKLVGTAGTEFTAGTITFDGRCYASIVMRRDLRDGNTYRAYVEDSPTLNAEVRKFAELLGSYGPANFQFRIDDGVPRVFEINARFSGTTPLRAHAGFNEVEMVIRHVVDGTPVSQPAVEPLIIMRHWSETVIRADGLIGGEKADA